MRVVIAEDNALLRDGLALLLADHGLQVVAAVADAAGLLDAVATAVPDLVITDVRMPPTHTNEGLLAAQAIRREHPHVGVLVMSQWVETHYAQRLLATSPTSIGYLLKDRVLNSGDFVAAARRVADGGTCLDPDVVKALLSDSAASGLNVLSTRELEVLGRLAEGLSNAAIATELHLAIRSIEKIISSIFLKLDLHADTTSHRRVLAVLRLLHNHPSPR